MLLCGASFAQVEDDSQMLDFAIVNPGPQPAPPDGSAYLYARWTPAVIYADGKTSTKLEVWTTAGVKEAWLGDEETKSHELNDRGINGDKKAGDNIWTLGKFTRSWANLQFPNHSQRGEDVVLKLKDGSLVIQTLPSLGLVRKLNIKAVKAKRNFWATRYTAFIIDKKGVLLGGKFPVCDVKCGKGNEKAFQKFYEVFPDRFHYLTVFPTCTIYRPADLLENVPYCVPVKNTVSNIGVDRFDKTADFGSKGKLQAIIYHSFGTGAILDHEVGHNFGIKIGDALGFSGASSKYGDAYGWHYSPYSNVVGQMAAHPQLQLEDNGDGTYKATVIPDQPSNRKFSKLTLYLMGLAAPDEVPPAMFLTDPDYPNYNRIPASKFDTYTIDDIIASNNGERQPAYPKAQKRFKMGLIVVTDRKPTQAEYDFYAAIAKYFSSKDEGTAYLTPFYTTVEGRAKMVIKLPKVK